MSSPQKVGGYDDKIGVLVRTIAEKMRDFHEIPQHSWNLVHQRMERDLKNAASKVKSFFLRSPL